MEAVRVKPHSYLNIYFPSEQDCGILELEFPTPPTAARLVEYLNLPRDEILFITINKRRVSWEARAYPGDLVELFPFVGGG